MKLFEIKNHQLFLWFIAGAILIKFFLFAFIALHAPEGRYQNDSYEYLDTAETLASKSAFARLGSDGTLSYDFYRTPGYPAFLAFLMAGFRFSLNGVVFTQILLAVLAAWVTYKAAGLIDEKIAFLSGLIVLYDPPVSIFSLQVLSETLFMFILALFMLSFTGYLKNRKLSMIISSALLLVAATYVRPTTYYLGWLMGIFIIYANPFRSIKKAIIHTLIFLVIVYSLLGLWQERNYRRVGVRSFCNVVYDGYRYFGLYKSYARNRDAQVKEATPVAYYARTSFRSLLNLMARPGPFKYFKSQVISAVGNAWAYPWMVFWWIGLIAGIAMMRRNIYYQFALFIILYFMAASIGGVSVLVSERFRVPMVPFIAVIAAYGWSILTDYAVRRRETK